MGAWVAGVDLGATKIAIGLIDPLGHIVVYRRLPTAASEGPAAAVERIAQAILDLEQTGGSPVAAVGICCPGPLDHQTGIVIDPPNLPGWRHVPLRGMLAERLGRPVCLEHDAKAAAWGEFHFGAGRGQKSMVYVVVGTGVGAAIIVDGQLYRGGNNSAGEVGHITLERDGEPCSCGRRGCVETRLSGPSLARRYSEALGRAGRDAPAGAVTGEQVTHWAAQGDPLASEILEQAGRALGMAIASLAMIMDIDFYVVGGSVAKAGDLLLEPARRAVPDHAFASVAGRVRILASGLGEDAAILGCGLLARAAL